MKISRLEIKDRATLVDVKADFGDINVIYGRNGAGKTLMSEVFRAAENGVKIDLGTASFRLDDDSRVRSSEFRKRGLADRIRVFNRKFVEENVFGKDPKAIVLGHEVKEERDRADALQEEINGLLSDQAALLGQATQVQKSVDDIVIGCGKEIRDALGPVARIDGAHPRWRNFDRSDVDRIAEEIGDNFEAFARDANRIKVISNSFNESSFPALAEVKIERPDTSRWLGETKKLCEAKLGASLLDELNRNQQLASWLETGLDLMLEDGSCPFCHQGVPDRRLSQLRSFFTNAYGKIGKRIDVLSKEISRWLDDVADPEFPDADNVRAHVRESYRTSVGEMRRMLQLHRESSNALLGLLKEKRADLSTVLRVDGLSQDWNEGTISQLNSLIRTHNDQAEVVVLGREYERAKVAGIMPELVRGNREIERLEKDTASKAREVKDKTREREAALRAARSEARAAAQLTRLLGEFIGHREITVQLNEDGLTFRLVRKDAKLIEPSEGEYNALGLMYFLMRLEDDRFRPDESVVVFDDPITSFDDQRVIDAVAKILYRTKIKPRDAAGVGQVFFLTHHLGLLDRLWRELKRPSLGARFFELRTSMESIESVRSTSIVQVKTPARFRYHIAFGEVYDMAFKSLPANNPGNSIRLCIEGFMFNLTPTAFGDGMNLEGKLNKVYGPDERNSITRDEIHTLCRVANAGSHDDLPDRPVNVADELATYQGAARKLMQLIEEVAPMHYKDMEQGAIQRHES